tara:strand:- start:122 stop:421 length:300 start_codon:yes stop_codon:yes gene_type:complete
MTSQETKKSDTKAPISERVKEKTMGMTKWFTEQYFQTFEMISKDPRYKTLPQYNQTSMLATVIIATNAALDKAREARTKEERVAKLEEINQDSVERKTA